MKLVSYDVEKGDSFLLEQDNHTILVDGGSNINNVLEKKYVDEKHFNLIVCTHYDDDHAEGILQLLEEEYTFNELWLPDKMEVPKTYLEKSSVYQILKDIHEIAFNSIDYDKYLTPKKKCVDIQNELGPREMLKQAKKDFIDQEKIKLKERILGDRDYFLCNKEYEKFFNNGFIRKLYLKFNINENHILNAKISIKEKKKILEIIYKNIKIIENELRDCIKEPIWLLFWMFLKKVYREQFLILTKCVLNTCILYEASAVGIIKWFKYEENYVNNILHKDYNVRLMNAIPVCEYELDKPLKEVLLNCIYSYSKDSNVYNHESFVLLYESESFPNILFSGDSDYIWLQKSKKNIELKLNSIVTAAHHGSKTGELIYDNNYIHDIAGDNKTFIYLRSDSDKTSGYKRRPCKRYKLMKKKYCRYCAESKIVLNYDSSKGEFISEQDECKC